MTIETIRLTPKELFKSIDLIRGELHQAVSGHHPFQQALQACFPNYVETGKILPDGQYLIAPGADGAVWGYKHRLPYVDSVFMGDAEYLAKGIEGEEGIIWTDVLQISGGKTNPHLFIISNKGMEWNSSSATEKARALVNELAGSRLCPPGNRGFYSS